MMKFVVLTLTAFVAFSSTAWAGNDWSETRNGGYVVLCASQPAQVLDLYEAQSIHGLTLDKEAQQGSLEQHFARLLTKLARVDAERAILYNTWFQDFFKDVQYISNSTFYPIPDIGYTVIAKDCRLELAIFQRAPSIFNKYRYRINQDLWQQLDERNKAALVLHELIYREYTTFVTGIETSEPTRLLNSWLNSAEFANLDLLTYMTILQEAQFKEIFYNGFLLQLGKWLPLRKEWNRYYVNYYDGNSVEKARFGAVPFYVQDLLKPVQSCLITDLVQLSGEVTFDRASHVEKLVVFFDNEPCLYKYRGNSGRYNIKSDKATLFKDGTMELSGLYNSNDLVRVNERFFIFSNETSQRARFYLGTDGEVKKIILENRACLDSDGRSIFVTSEVGEDEFDLATSEINLPNCAH